MALRAAIPRAAPHPVSQQPPALTASSSLAERAGNAFPLALSVILASAVVWGTLFLPWAFAVGIVAFFAYWMVRSWAVAVACIVGMRRIARWKRTEWRTKYAQWHRSRPAAEPWDWPRHLVIIPNYKESETGLARALESLAAQSSAQQIVVVMAMEAREQGARGKAARLVMRYRSCFGDMFATYHPAGLPGETAGKGANEAWAAREACDRLVVYGDDDIDRYTVTSCDADAVFHASHFDALNYLFLTSRDRYRAFWQPAIVNSNNIWDIPAPLRLPDGLSGINRISNLVLPGSVKFPTSCYSTSWRMLTAVDYWDEEVIPEDWHLYLKCCLTLGDRVHVEPLYLPLGNDCVLAGSYWKTLKAHYAQSVRHAWGASDIPYAWRAAFNGRTPLSRSRRFALVGAVTKIHALWVAQWYLITLGSRLPVALSNSESGMPHWWLSRSLKLPGPSWRFDALFSGDFSHAVRPWLSLSIADAMIYVCIVPFFAIIAIELKLRGPRPAYVTRKAWVAQFAIWPLMAVITFFWSSLPALHAQWKLASGRGLVYRVAEKGSRKVPAPVMAVAGGKVRLADGEPAVALGGGGS